MIRSPQSRQGVTAQQDPTPRFGVTLIEIVLVIMILGAAAVTTTFALDSQWSDRREARASTLDVSRLLTLARNTAIEKQTIVHVYNSGSVGASQIDIVEDPGPLTPGRKWSAPLSPLVQVQGNPKSIQFRADGSADATLKWSVVVNRVQGEVSVSPVGGTIQHKVP